MAPTSFRLIVGLTPLSTQKARVFLLKMSKFAAARAPTDKRNVKMYQVYVILPKHACVSQLKCPKKSELIVARLCGWIVRAMHGRVKGDDMNGFACFGGAAHLWCRGGRQED